MTGEAARKAETATHYCSAPAPLAPWKGFEYGPQLDQSKRVAPLPSGQCVCLRVSVCVCPSSQLVCLPCTCIFFLYTVFSFSFFAFLLFIYNLLLCLPLPRPLTHACSLDTPAHTHTLADVHNVSVSGAEAVTVRLYVNVSELLPCCKLCQFTV